MIEFNYHEFFRYFIVGMMLIALLVAVVLSSGCITAAKNTATEVMKTPTPTPTPSPTPTPTPKPTPLPTPSSIPTLAPHFVDPFMPGERWEGQWFQWHRMDVQGINGEGTKDLWVGIIAYRHKFLDSYTWYNAADANYYVQTPSAGKRYLAVWVHEEMMGDNASYDPSMWVFDESAFLLQYKNYMIAPDESHQPWNRIKEFDGYTDYYDTVIAGPFAWDIRYTGVNPETGGYNAFRRGWLRMGKGNAVDGYILFEVPKEAYESDLLLSGRFSTFGDAYWRLSR